MNPNIKIDKERAIERAHWIAEQRVPFVHQGTSLHGIDCIGALAFILEYEGQIPEYPQDPVNDELDTHLRGILGDPYWQFTKAVPLTDITLLAPCDIVSMQYAGPVRHVGFVVPHINLPGELSLVHTDSNVGRTTEHRIDAKWLRRVAKVWRV